jgi:hypothetical protein
MVTVIRPSRARCVNGRIPRRGRAVFTFGRVGMPLRSASDLNDPSFSSRAFLSYSSCVIHHSGVNAARTGLKTGPTNTSTIGGSW